MGGTRYSDDEYESRNAAIRSAGYTSAFRHTEDIQRGNVQAGCHELMRPYGLTFREARDSDVHPNSIPVAIMFDVTGSMADVPKTFQEKLNRVMSLIMVEGHIPDPAILIGAIGDCTSDQAPLQVGQFESGAEINDDLSRVWLERRGGGGGRESYELAFYFLSRKTACDHFEKRGQKGYAFILGDEMARDLTPSAVRQVFGDEIEAPIPMAQLVAEAQEKWDIYFIIPALTSHFNDAAMRKYWTDLLGQNVLILEDPSSVSEMIATTIGLSEGTLDHSAVTETLQRQGATRGAEAVSRATSNIRSRRSAESVPSSGAPSGLATV